MMALLLLDYLLPLLAFFGALAVVSAALLLGFWPWWAPSIIQWLTVRQQAREQRRKARSARLARRMPR